MLNYDKDKMHSKIYLQCFFGSLLHFYNTLSVIVQCFRISEPWFDSSGLITRMIGEDTLIKARKRKSLSGRMYWRNSKIFTQAHSLGEWVGHTFVVVYIRACSNFVHSETTFNGIQRDPVFFYCATISCVPGLRFYWLFGFKCFGLLHPEP